MKESMGLLYYLPDNSPIRACQSLHSAYLDIVHREEPSDHRASVKKQLSFALREDHKRVSPTKQKQMTAVVLTD